MQRHVLLDAIEQRPFTPETCELYGETRAIQPVGNLEELTFGAADKEMINELQNADRTHMLVRKRTLQLLFQWNRGSQDGIRCSAFCDRA
jgi:hypothetical protein